jgi:NADPH-dependent dioxygenase
VLIVGGGAVGCVLSMELARRGVEYRCIERMPGPGRESRAIAMHARTVELLDLVDKELSRRILDRDLWCKGYVMHFLRDGERTEVRPGLDYTTVDSRYNCILAHNQSETETFVRDYTLSRFGKTIEYNTTFQDLNWRRTAHRADHTCRSRRGEEEFSPLPVSDCSRRINSRAAASECPSRQGLAGSFQNLDIH